MLVSESDENKYYGHGKVEYLLGKDNPNELGWYVPSTENIGIAVANVAKDAYALSKDSLKDFTLDQLLEELLTIVLLHEFSHQEEQKYKPKHKKRNKVDDNFGEILPKLGFGYKLILE